MYVQYWLLKTDIKLKTLNNFSRKKLYAQLRKKETQTQVV